MSAGARPLEFPVEGLTEGDIRLRLRTDADVPAVVAACRDPEIPRWTRVPEDYDEATAREWDSLAAREAAEGQGLHLLVVDAESGELLGSVGIVDISWQERRCDIGYWTVAEHRGRGITTRAVKLLSAWAFDELGFDRISICAEPENEASRAVAERAGFSYEGVLRGWHLNKGTRRDAAIYSLLRGELR